MGSPRTGHVSAGNKILLLCENSKYVSKHKTISPDLSPPPYCLELQWEDGKLRGHRKGRNHPSLMATSFQLRRAVIIPAGLNIFLRPFSFLISRPAIDWGSFYQIFLLELPGIVKGPVQTKDLMTSVTLSFTISDYNLIQGFSRAIP